ncbi:polyadenylate-binding protein B-binding protein [Salix suchowensis]|nr:polyadenylate-binding protein B-binding protein [Salix suchowensis]
MQFLGVLGIYQEAYMIIFSSRKIFGQITLALILPLSFILLAQIEVSSVFSGEIMNNEVELLGTEAGTERYNKLSDHISSEFAYFWIFKVACLILSLVFSLLSTAAVVYTIASIYAGREVSFKKVMSAVPKVWKRLMVTFLSVFVALLAYGAVAILVSSIVFMAWFAFIGFSNLKVLYSLGIVLLVLYLTGSVYLTIIWLLASAVSVLEEVCGFKAMTKSRALIKGKMWTAIIMFFNMSITSGVVTIAFQNLVVHGVSMNMAGRVFLGVICSALFLGLFLFGSVTQTVIYFVCKSNHHENIEKSALSDHLEAYHGEYAPLKSKDLQLEQYDV